MQTAEHPGMFFYRKLLTIVQNNNKANKNTALVPDSITYKQGDICPDVLAVVALISDPYTLRPSLTEALAHCARCGLRVTWDAELVRCRPEGTSADVPIEQTVLKTGLTFAIRNTHESIAAN